MTPQYLKGLCFYAVGAPVMVAAMALEDGLGVAGLLAIFLMAHGVRLMFKSSMRGLR